MYGWYAGVRDAIIGAEFRQVKGKLTVLSTQSNLKKLTEYIIDTGARNNVYITVFNKDEQYLKISLGFEKEEEKKFVTRSSDSEIMSFVRELMKNDIFLTGKTTIGRKEYKFPIGVIQSKYVIYVKMFENEDSNRQVISSIIRSGRMRNIEFVINESVEGKEAKQKNGNVVREVGELHFGMYSQTLDKNYTYNTLEELKDFIKFIKEEYKVSLYGKGELDGKVIYENTNYPELLPSSPKSKSIKKVHSTSPKSSSLKTSSAKKYPSSRRPSSRKVSSTSRKRDRKSVV